MFSRTKMWMDYIAKDHSSMPPPLNLADIVCFFKYLCTVIHSVVIIILILITIIVIFITIFITIISMSSPPPPLLLPSSSSSSSSLPLLKHFPSLFQARNEASQEDRFKEKQKEVNELLKVVLSTHPSLPPSLPPILSFIMIANIFYLPLNSTEDFHNQASCVPISAPILRTQQLRIFSRYSNSKSKQR